MLSLAEKAEHVMECGNIPYVVEKVQEMSNPDILMSIRASSLQRQ